MRTSTLPVELQPIMRSVPEESLSNALLYASAEYFDAEMSALAGSSWHFFCTTDDLANVNDWVRRKVFGVDVFVQNFIGDLRGFHNVCQHRGFPLRREERGNGTVQCFLHGWAYSPDGVPLGVTRNKDLFGLTREQKAALALPEIRVASVGRFVFVALQASVPPIEEFLGSYAAILRAISNSMRSLRYRWTGPVHANWKLYNEVTLDDYHVVYVHPTTLSADPVATHRLFYERHGLHSHMFARRDADWRFAGFWDDVAAGKFDFTGYKIQQLFPNLIVVTKDHWVLVTLLTPQGPALTQADDLMFDMNEHVVDDPLTAEAWDAHRLIAAEDSSVVEELQQTIAQFARRPTYGFMETRLAWFHEAYEKVVGAEARRRLMR